MNIFLYRQAGDEITCIARADTDDGTVGDAFFKVKAGGKLFGIPFEEIKTRLETSGVVEVGERAES